MERKGQHPECKYVHELIDKEMSLKIHLLNTFNNEKFGFKKGDPYADYESGMLFWGEVKSQISLTKMCRNTNNFEVGMVLDIVDPFDKEYKDISR